MEATIWGWFLLSFRLALLLYVLLFQVRCHSPTLHSHAELCFDHQTVADWSQFFCKAMSNFILICSLQLFLWWLGGGAKLWKYMIDASAGKCVIAAGCVRQCGFLLVSSRNQGHLSLIAPLRCCSPSLRHVSYLAPGLSVTAGGTTIVSTMMDSYHSVNRCVNFVARGCSQIRSSPHGSTSRLTSGLTEKTKLNVC